tara:strand:+ start:1218 stop:1376 length:159 start_codon:yes stop_codon:yes gene_type:complete
VIEQIDKIVLSANTVTMAIPTRWKGNIVLDYVSETLHYLVMNIGKNINMDDR